MFRPVETYWQIRMMPQPRRRWYMLWAAVAYAGLTVLVVALVGFVCWPIWNAASLRLLPTHWIPIVTVILSLCAIAVFTFSLRGRVWRMLWLLTLHLVALPFYISISVHAANSGIEVYITERREMAAQAGLTFDPNVLPPEGASTMVICCATGCALPATQRGQDPSPDRHGRRQTWGVFCDAHVFFGSGMAPHSMRGFALWTLITLAFAGALGSLDRLGKFAERKTVTA